jgi:hypothetical protein
VKGDGGGPNAAWLERLAVVLAFAVRRRAVATKGPQPVRSAFTSVGNTQRHQRGDMPFPASPTTHDATNDQVASFGTKRS